MWNQAGQPQSNNLYQSIMGPSVSLTYNQSTLVDSLHNINQQQFKQPQQQQPQSPQQLITQQEKKIGMIMILKKECC